MYFLVYICIPDYLNTIITDRLTAIMINLQTKVKHNEESFTVSGLGDEAVMMNLATGDFLGLNPVAADIWELMAEPVSVGDLIKKLTEKYEIDEADCTTETLKYLETMQQEKMLLVVGE